MAQEYPVVSDRSAWLEANDLMVRFGEFAQVEAAIRADRSRVLGNLAHFCHWRAIERTIELLSSERATGTIH